LVSAVSAVSSVLKSRPYCSWWWLRECGRFMCRLVGPSVNRKVRLQHTVASRNTSTSVDITSRMTEPNHGEPQPPWFYGGLPWRRRLKDSLAKAHCSSDISDTEHTAQTAILNTWNTNTIRPKSHRPSRWRLSVRNTRNYIQYFLTLVLFTFCTYNLRCLVCIVVSCLVCIVVVVLCAFLSSYVYLLYYVCIAVFTLDAGLLARSQYSEGPATGHLDTGFSWFPYVYKQMLRWFPRFQVATTCFSCGPPNLNLLLTTVIICIHLK